MTCELKVGNWYNFRVWACPLGELIDGFLYAESFDLLYFLIPRSVFKQESMRGYKNIELSKYLRNQFFVFSMIKVYYERQFKQIHPPFEI